MPDKSTSEHIADLEAECIKLRRERDEARRKADQSTAQLLMDAMDHARKVADHNMAIGVGANKDSLEMFLNVASLAHVEANRAMAKTIHDMRNDIQRLTEAVFVQHRVMRKPLPLVEDDEPPILPKSHCDAPMLALPIMDDN